jgi:hypothetical protein
MGWFQRSLQCRGHGKERESLHRRLRREVRAPLGGQNGRFPGVLLKDCGLQSPIDGGGQNPFSRTEESVLPDVLPHASVVLQVL